MMVVFADCIAIKLLRSNCLLAGVGNELHMHFLNDKNETIHKYIQLSFRSKIYGISSAVKISSEFELFVIHGGRDIGVAIVNGNNDFRIVKRLTFNEWISSIRIYGLTNDNRVSLCILTAHNVAVNILLDIDGNWEIGKKSNCTDKCTLYCSFIIGSRWLDSTILCGNAFGELIIWSILDQCEPCAILHRINGHKGVIFSIDYSISKGIITTTSDDRSVKIWKINSESKEINWTNCTIEPFKSLYGHMSRIFNHKIIVFNGSDYIISIGEDSVACIWSIDGELICKENIGFQHPLWNLEYDAKRQYLFTCGRDGNIYQINLKNKLYGKFSHKSQKLLDKQYGGEYATKLAIIPNEEVLVIVTNQYNLYYRKVNANQNEKQWNSIVREESSVTLLEPFGSCIAYASLCKITVFKYENNIFKLVIEKDFFDGVVRSFKFLSEKEFLVCDIRGHCSFLEIQDEAFNFIEFNLPACKERWITAAMKSGQYIVVGDRCGNIHLYEINEEKCSIELRWSLKYVHGKFGCTSIICDPTNELNFITTGHDGRMKLVSINASKIQLEHQFTHEVPVKWCDKALVLDASDSCLLLIGFNDSHFVTWKNDNSYRFEFDCGGGHRSWDLYLDKKKMHAILIYIRNKTLYYIQFDLNDTTSHPFRISMNKWHSRPCNTVQIIESNKDRYLTISGGDDNLLKVNDLIIRNGKAEIRHQMDVALHISNIKTITVLTIANELSWLIFSAGGRAQICVTKLQIVPGQPLSARELCDFMLRSTDTERKRAGISRTTSIDPETRFMSLTACHQHESNNVFIYVGCSDGFIRSFVYSNQKIILTATKFYGHCILHVYHFNFSSHHYLLSMATDGLIAFWSIENLVEISKPFYTLKHHHSGINSFDVYINESQMIIATGGDDQMVVFSKLALERNTDDDFLKVVVEKTMRFPFVHTAQVNGVQLCEKGQKLYTIGVDQTIMFINLDDSSVEQISLSCISDAKGLKLIRDWDCALVYGCGVQVIYFNEINEMYSFKCPRTTKPGRIGSKSSGKGC